VKSRAVTFDPQAIEDLGSIHDWITDQASSTTADRYAERLLNFCAQFDLFPQRGEARDDLYPGLRIAVFEHRVGVAFKIYDQEVRIVRLWSGARDLQGIFPDPQPSRSSE
jgi:toxin ParE1/3/4